MVYNRGCIPEGFLERGGEILSNVASAPKLFADIFTDPLQPGYIEAQQRVQKAGEALKQRVSSQYQKGTEDIRRGDVTSGLARYIAATSNFVPSPAVQMISTAPDIAEAFTEDKPGQATADLVAALLPSALEAPGFGGAIKGAAKGAYSESVAPVPVPPPMPAQMKTKCAPSIIFLMSSRSISAHLAPTSG